MQLNETPKGVSHSSTKHLFSYVEMRVAVCQFPSHPAVLCQMCCNSSGPDRPVPLPLLSDGPPPQLFPICCPRSYSRSISSISHFPRCSPPPVLYLSFPFLLCSSPSSHSSSSYLPRSSLIGGVRKGSAMTSSGPPTDPVPPFSKPSFLAISPVLVFWLGPRPPRHKGLIMGYNWLACVARLWDGPLPVPPCPPLLFVFGLLLKNWASNLVSGQRGKPSVSGCLSPQPVINRDIVCYMCICPQWLYLCLICS